MACASIATSVSRDVSDGHFFFSKASTEHCRTPTLSPLYSIRQASLRGELDDGTCLLRQEREDEVAHRHDVLFYQRARATGLALPKRRYGLELIARRAHLHSG